MDKNNSGPKKATNIVFDSLCILIKAFLIFISFAVKALTKISQIMETKDDENIYDDFNGEGYREGHSGWGYYNANDQKISD